MKILFFLCAMFIAAGSSAQYSFKGTITESGTGRKLPGASVYIPELKTGALTDNDGAFVIKNIRAGRFTVQFSLQGHKTAFMEIAMSDTTVPVHVSLESSFIEMKEVQVMGTQVKSPDENPLTVSSVNISEIKESGALSVSDALSKLPGMGQLTTGAGISKPVIRGLYGNRILVQVMGIRFDNQQWQDEHGLGLSPMGISRLEVIKGPASLLYGGDALGGVINVIEERPAPVDSLSQDVNLSLFSNTRGISADYGIKKSTAKMWWRARAGMESNADYSSGGDKRVLNSRFAGYHFKASVGTNHLNWTNVNNVYVSYDLFGFIFDSIDRKIIDDRLSRTFDGPHHSVLFGLVSSENTVYVNKTKIRINAGFISNNRQEQEGGNRISLDMVLNTATLVAQATTQIGETLEWTYGTSGMYQTNTNYGSRTIIPNASTFEGSVYSYIEKQFKKLVLEAGLRYDYRNITTTLAKTLNGPAADIHPFDRDFGSLNGSLGAVYNITSNFGLKGNISSGYRSANLAELSSDGLHEGTLRWEIGNPDLKPEQNLNTELGFFYEWNDVLELNATAFYNTFLNYIYLAPTGTEYIGFDIFHFKQTDATIKGSEIALDIHPRALKSIDLHVAYTLLDAKKEDNTYLPFIPANKIDSDIRFKPKQDNPGKFRNWFFKPGANYVFAQDHPSEFEKSSPSYFLLNAAVGGSFLTHKSAIDVVLVCNNLTDVTYADHLSRLRYYGINNIGRNISLSVHIPF